MSSALSDSEYVQVMMMRGTLQSSSDFGPNDKQSSAMSNANEASMKNLFNSAK